MDQADKDAREIVMNIHPTRDEGEISAKAAIIAAALRERDEEIARLKGLADKWERFGGCSECQAKTERARAECDALTQKIALAKEIMRHVNGIANSCEDDVGRAAIHGTTLPFLIEPPEKTD